MKILIPGILASIIAIVATVSAGFFVGLNTEFDVTPKVMFAMFVLPTPYAFVTFVGLSLYHTKRWMPIAMTFNIGAVVLLLLWFTNNLLLIDSSKGWGIGLEQSLDTNLFYTSIVAGVFTVVMIIEGQIAWPETKPTVNPMDD